MSQTKVADLTVDDLRKLIREIVTQTLFEVVGDLDEGPELRAYPSNPAARKAIRPQAKCRKAR